MLLLATIAAAWTPPVQACSGTGGTYSAPIESPVGPHVPQGAVIVMTSWAQDPVLVSDEGTMLLEPTEDPDIRRIPWDTPPGQYTLVFTGRYQDETLRVVDRAEWSGGREARLAVERLDLDWRVSSGRTSCSDERKHWKLLLDLSWSWTEQVWDGWYAEIRLDGEVLERVGQDVWTEPYAESRVWRLDPPVDGDREYCVAVELFDVYAVSHGVAFRDCLAAPLRPPLPACGSVPTDPTRGTGRLALAGLALLLGAGRRRGAGACA